MGPSIFDYVQRPDFDMRLFGFIFVSEEKVCLAGVYAAVFNIRGF